MWLKRLSVLANVGAATQPHAAIRYGGVRYEVEWPGLSSDEMRDGYVLPCVAHPCSDVELKQGE